jgi:hypothetical protein
MSGRMASCFMSKQFTFFHKSFSATFLLTFVRTFACMRPHVSSEIGLMSKLSEAVMTFKGLLTFFPKKSNNLFLFKLSSNQLHTSVNSYVTCQFIFLTKFLVAIFAFKLTDILMEDFDVSLKLKKCTPGLVWTNFARILNFK